MNHSKSESNINTEIIIPKIENIKTQKKSEDEPITEEPRYVIDENDISDDECENDVEDECENDVEDECDNDNNECENDVEDECENDVEDECDNDNNECENDVEDENMSLYEILKFYLNRIFG